MAVWDDVLTGMDRAVFEAFDRGKDLGKRPAVVVVDMNYAFVGLKPEPILESIKTYKTSCGEVGWTGVARIGQLLPVAREQGIPVIYSTGITSDVRGAGWANRARAKGSLEVVSEEELEKRRVGNTIVKEIEPQPGDIVINKRGPSVFHGTPLVSYLNEMDIDTLLVCGTTTSGCVRATVVDGACHNYYVGIIEDCTFDRFVISHKVSLMDMHAKYGTVISLGEGMEYLKSQAEPTRRARKLSSVGANG